ncbi:MAG: hypothetical protein M1497_14335 [Nitrospirae bacterium]|nr:hypothetical protein [Nitrospirota bacterium]
MKALHFFTDMRKGDTEIVRPEPEYPAMPTTQMECMDVVYRDGRQDEKASILFEENGWAAGAYIRTAHTRKIAAPRTNILRCA